MMADRYVLEAEPAPCPFCGSAGSRLLVDPDYVQCVECGGKIEILGRRFDFTKMNAEDVTQKS